MKLLDTIKGWFKPKSKRLKESHFGRPVPLFDTLPYGRREPLFTGWPHGYGRDTAEHGKPLGIHNLDHLLRAVAHCQRVVVENPNGAALMEGLEAYVVGNGPTIKVNPVEGEDVDPDNIKLAQRILRRFGKVNHMTEKYGELLRRRHRDGDAFMRLFPDETPVVRFVNAHQVRPPSAHGREWEWGVHTDPDDVTMVLGYGVWSNGTDFEEVEPQFVVHSKANADSTNKRGTPSFFPALDDLEGAAKLRHHAREGATVRESIAYIRQFILAEKSAIQTLQGDEATGTYELHLPEGGQRTEHYRIREPGTVEDIPDGLEYKPPPSSPNTTFVDLLLRASLRAAAARFNAPDWLASANHDDTNFAASLTAESPFIKRIELEQRRLGEAVCDLHTRVLEIAVEMGELPESALEEMEVTCDWPSPAVRDADKETNRRKVLREAGIITDDEWRTEEGYEPHEQEAQAT